MNNQERIAGIDTGEYQELFGVKKEMFERMLAILQDKFHTEHLRGGHPPKLSVLDKLIITLDYYREYRAMNHISPLKNAAIHVKVLFPLFPWFLAVSSG